MAETGKPKGIPAGYVQTTGKANAKRRTQRQ